jgi:hypothetical protein
MSEKEKRIKDKISVLLRLYEDDEDSKRKYIKII